DHDMVDLALHIGGATDRMGRRADKAADFRLDDHGATPAWSAPAVRRPVLQPVLLPCRHQCQSRAAKQKGAEAPFPSSNIWRRPLLAVHLGAADHGMEIDEAHHAAFMG